MSKGSNFWRKVRKLRREIAIRLYMEDHRDLGVFTIPTDKELREGGYIQRAHNIALRKIAIDEPNYKARRRNKT